MSTIDDGDDIERWTAKRKLEVVKESLQEDVSEEQLCQTYGITRNEFRQWKENALDAGKNALVERRGKDPKEKKIEKLEKKVGQLTVINDELKKS
jgi:transposase-like protein